MHRDRRIILQNKTPKLQKQCFYTFKFSMFLSWLPRNYLVLVYRIERKLLRSFLTCNPRLGELRDYGCLAQGQLSHTSERWKVSYDFVLKITPGYQSKIHSLPRPSGRKDCRTFPFWIALGTAQPYPWPREVREGDITCPRWTSRLMEGRGYLTFPILDCLYILLVCMGINWSYIQKW